MYITNVETPDIEINFVFEECFVICTLSTTWNSS